VIEVREIQSGSTAQAAPAMLELRPRWETAEALVDFIDDALRPTGYRIVGVLDDRESEALAVAGFREVRSLAWVTTSMLTTSPLSLRRGARVTASSSWTCSEDLPISIYGYVSRSRKEAD
jgi:hypothetical protein